MKAKFKIIILAVIILTIITFCGLFSYSVEANNNVGLWICNEIELKFLDYNDYAKKRPTNLTIDLACITNSNYNEKLTVSLEQDENGYGKIVPSIQNQKLIDDGYGYYYNVPVKIEYSQDENDSRITNCVISTLHKGVKNSDESIYRWYSGLFYLDDVPATYYKYQIEDVIADGYKCFETSGNLIPGKFNLYAEFTPEFDETYVATALLYYETNKTINLNVKYNDDQARDSYLYRTLKFKLQGNNISNLSQEKQDKINISEYNFYEVTEEKAKEISLNKQDEYTYEFETTPIIYGVIDGTTTEITYDLLDNGTTKYDGVTVDYNLDEQNGVLELNGTATVNYSAQKMNLPISVKWEDQDNLYNVRPDEITISAYDQAGNFEKSITISKDSDWNTIEQVFKNMIYSGGTPIEYVLKIDNTDNYEYTIEGDNNGFVITAKLTEKQREVPVEKIESPTETENQVEEVIDTPKTGDNIYFYMGILIFSITSLIVILIIKIHLRSK